MVCDALESLTSYIIHIGCHIFLASLMRIFRIGKTAPAQCKKTDTMFILLLLLYYHVTIQNKVEKSRRKNEYLSPPAYLEDSY